MHKFDISVLAPVTLESTFILIAHVWSVKKLSASAVWMATEKQYTHC